MQNDDSKPNTRSKKRKRNKKTKIKKNEENLDICKINNGNDGNDGNDEDEEEINVIIEDIIVKDEDNNDDLKSENQDVEENQDVGENQESSSLKRKIESIFDNNTIIMFNKNSGKNDLDNIFNIPIGENELIEDGDDEYEEMNDQIEKSRKYVNNNPNFLNYNQNEAQFFLNSSIKNKNKINKFEKKTIELNKEKTPLRFKIINSKIDDNLKAIALKKLNHLSSMNERSGEYFKILNYVENLCKIPCGIYKKLNIPKQPKDISNFLLNSYNILNKNVYGHDKSKEQIIRIIGQWISNPELKGNVIGIHGSPGCGKTRLIKEGLCKALNLPFVFIPLGGINDSSYLTGHSFTYEGAIHGKIVDSLMKAQCMNPIIYFDELDKVSDSSRGEEIINTLIHMTDSTQNDAFFDKYFYDIPLNLSKALIIFTYNDDMRINRILRDRMIRINTESYKNKDKIHISKEFLIPELLKDFNFSTDELIFTDEIIKYIITKSETEDGVRNLRRSIECIISNINLYRLMNKNNKNNLDLSFSINKLNIEYETPFIINKKIIDHLIKTHNDMDNSLSHLYT